jgi:Helix-turn-helix
MAEKTYYLKWNVDEGSFLLDKRYKASDFCYSIRKLLITEDQAAEFADRIQAMYIDKSKIVNMNVLEFEFDKFFHVCKVCKTPTSHVQWAKRQGDWCWDCYQENIRENWKESRKKTIELERVDKMKDYIKTDQGRCDVVGLDTIKVNIDIQLRKHGKTRKDLAQALGSTEKAIVGMMNKNQSIKIEYLYTIAEWLFVPIDLLLKMPRGAAPLKKKNGIPISVYRQPMKTIK